jgi:SAM-dependent methyltransferase
MVNKAKQPIHNTKHTSLKNNTSENVLTDQQRTSLETLLTEAKSDKSMELEISFKKISYADYIRIVEVLINETDGKNITSTKSLDVSIEVEAKNSLRISLFGEDPINAFIQKYAKSHPQVTQKYLTGLKQSDEVEMIFKNGASAKREYVNDFDFVIKLASETKVKTIPNLTGTEKMMYRYKDRISFNRGSFRLDLTTVQESNFLNNLSTRFPKYEIEIEVIDSKTDIDSFEKEIYYALQLIQNSLTPISNTEAMDVVKAYGVLLNLHKTNHLDGRNVISIESHHIVNFLPNKYGVTDKPDGERYFLISVMDKVYLLSSNLVVKKTSMVLDKHFDKMILDGELIKHNGKQMFLAFDVVYAHSVDYRFNAKFNLNYRLNILNEIIDKAFGNLVTLKNYLDEHTDTEPDRIRKFYQKELSRYWKTFNEKLESDQSEIFISRKIYFIPYGIEPFELFMYADLIWKSYVYDHLTPYVLDGLIFTPINSPYMIKASPDNLDSVPMEYKWKPPKYNSIDFYIQFDRDEKGVESIFYDNVVKQHIGKPYKICYLHVGVHNGSVERPVPFKINDVPQKANIYLEDDEARDINGNVIDDGTVVEFIYDNTKVGTENALKWIPIRTRYDKTESVIKYKTRYGNNLNIALRIWRTIINPVSEDDVASLANPHTYTKEMARLGTVSTIVPTHNTTYYQKRTTDAEGMRAFNNWVKKNMISTYCSPGINVLDIGCGRGGDLRKFIHAQIGTYVGIDIDYNGLFRIKDSAFNRYKYFKNELPHVPPMTFIHADAKGIFNVQSQSTILAPMPEANKKMIDIYLTGKKKYDVINCQFSLHYYLSDELSWSHFCKNINSCIADNGYFLVTCFDGAILKQRLESKPKLTISYTDNQGKKNVFCEILKVYSDNDTQPIGKAIDLYNSLISEEGKYIREYLVEPEFLKQSLKKNCGLELVETDTFVNLFGLYKNYFTQEIPTDSSEIKMHKEIRNYYLSLNPDYHDLFSAEQIEINMASFKFTSLNRYYIFKKTTGVDLVTASRVVGINHSIDMGRILTPYFNSNRMMVDDDAKSKIINKVYQGIRKENPSVQPHTYLIRHTVGVEEFGDDVLSRNKFDLVKVKEGASSDVLLLYKSPEKFFYPVYYKSDHGDKSFFKGDHVMEDLDTLVSIHNAR